MSKNLSRLVLFLIIILGFFFRYINLDSIPSGFNWDEASVAYNAYCLLKTGHDEYARPWPLFIESFGDYKTALYSFMLVPIIKYFGLSIFSARILNVFIGSSLILASYIFALTFFKKKTLALLVAFLMATSPLAIHFSRFVLEWYAAIPIFLLAVSLILPPFNSRWKMPLGAILLAFSLYWYHSLRLFLPFFLIAYTLIYFPELLKNKKIVGISFILAIIALLPLLISLQQNNILARPEAVSIFANQDQLRVEQERVYLFNQAHWPLKFLLANKYFYFGQEIIFRYLLHFSPQFLFFGLDATPRISNYPIGKFQLILLPFLIIGFYQLFKKSKKNLLLISWLLIAPLPASFTNDSPHGLRSLLLLPALLMVIVMGIDRAYQAMKKIPYRLIKLSLIFGCVLIFCLQFDEQMAQYFIFYPEATSQYWQAGQKELHQKLDEYQDQYQQIIIDNIGQSYIFYAFFHQVDPVFYQSQVKGQTASFNSRINELGKVKFGVNGRYFSQDNALIINRKPLNDPALKLLTIVPVPDRFQEPDEAFYFYETRQAAQ